MHHLLFQTIKRNSLYIVIAIPFALISLWNCGFDFAINNNLIHIPYVLGLDSSPEFIKDQFYQSLKNFTSGVWPLLRLICNESNIYGVFLYSNFVSRCAAFLAILYFIRNNGLKSKIEMMFGLGLFAVTPWLRGVSVIGGHGLFINYFTHTEATWPFILTALVFLQNRELVKTGAMVGISFAINAFVGIWLMLITPIAILYDRQTYRVGAWVRAGAVFFLFALPIVIWIAWVLIDGKTAEPFSFMQYIRTFYPSHFLIETAKPSQLYVLLLLYVCGFLSCRFMEQSRFWVGVQLGCLMLFVAGIPLPYLFDNKLIFNLHLLRSAGIEQFIAILLIGITGIKLLTRRVSSRSMMLGILIIAFTVFPYRSSSINITFIMLALAMALVNPNSQSKVAEKYRIVSIFERLFQSNYIPVLLLILWFIGTTLHKGISINLLIKFILLALCMAMFLDTISKGLQYKAIFGILCFIMIVSSVLSIRERIQQKALHRTDKLHWQEFTQWVKDSDLNGIFLLPLNVPNIPFHPQDTFQLLARRIVWVDHKQGAAVMWSPSFHKQWMSRFIEMSSLTDSDQLRDYATKKGLKYFVTIDGSGCPSDSKSLKISGNFALCQSQKY